MKVTFFPRLADLFLFPIIFSFSPFCQVRLSSLTRLLFLYKMFVLAPKRHFEIAFRMFDLDGDGNVDQQEFDKVSLSKSDTTSIFINYYL